VTVLLESHGLIQPTGGAPSCCAIGRRDLADQRALLVLGQVALLVELVTP
jgi:hypothetical protein